MKKLVLLILFIMFIAGCTSSPPQNSQGSVSDSTELQEYICPEITVPSNLIPTNSNLDDYEYMIDANNLNLINIDWEIETIEIMGIIINTYCNFGEREGENVNYIYCGPIEISKIISDESGNIVETLEHYMYLVYKPNEDSYSITQVKTTDKDIFSGHPGCIINFD